MDSKPATPNTTVIRRIPSFDAVAVKQYPASLVSQNHQLGTKKQQECWIMVLVCIV